MIVMCRKNTKRTDLTYLLYVKNKIFNTNFLLI